MQVNNCIYSSHSDFAKPIQWILFLSKKFPSFAPHLLTFHFLCFIIFFPLTCCVWLFFFSPTDFLLSSSLSFKLFQSLSFLFYLSFSLLTLSPFSRFFVSPSFFLLFYSLRFFKLFSWHVFSYVLYIRFSFLANLFFIISLFLYLSDATPVTFTGRVIDQQLRRSVLYLIQ